ncbi:hypothetical protein ABEU20_000682 [Rhodococcus sp. PAM 2766]|uniref:Uncharacterized protein n=1 Tax=Rhodococcus parequi TaxID=3137122 RepID=A0ABW9FA53_9NOCA
MPAAIHPADVPPSPPGQTYTAVAAGTWHSIASTSGGEIVAWGSVPQGQAVPAPPTGQTYTAIEAGPFHSLALTSGGQVVGWGSSGNSQLAFPTRQTYTGSPRAPSIPRH